MRLQWLVSLEIFRQVLLYEGKHQIYCAACVLVAVDYF
jgi:hypothetical protein